MAYFGNMKKRRPPWWALSFLGLLGIGVVGNLAGHTAAPRPAPAVSIQPTANERLAADLAEMLRDPEGTGAVCVGSVESDDTSCAWENPEGMAGAELATVGDRVTLILSGVRFQPNDLQEGLSGRPHKAVPPALSGYFIQRIDTRGGIQITIRNAAALDKT